MDFFLLAELSFLFCVHLLQKKNSGHIEQIIR